MPTTRRPPAPTLLTAASSASRPRAMMATSAPELAKRVAMANPIPLLAPVITAVRPARLTSIRDSRKCWHAEHTILSRVGRIDQPTARARRCPQPALEADIARASGAPVLTARVIGQLILL